MANIIEIVARFINEASTGLKQVGADVEGISQSTDATKTSTDDLGFSFDGLVGKLAGTLSVTALLTGAFQFLKMTIDAYGESEVVAAQVNAVLQSTNEIAGVTAEEIDNIANSLSQMSGADDEAIARGEALLLTFTKIGSDVFPQATEAALNMSMAMGTDLQSSIIQVGKALNDPIEGVSALRRVGVQLTDQQEEQIKQFMAVNDIAGAQKIVLAELETQFGGVAKMMGETTVGATNKLNVAWGNLMETIGEGNAEAQRGVTEWLTNQIEQIIVQQQAYNLLDEAVRKNIITEDERSQIIVNAMNTQRDWGEVVTEWEQKMDKANVVTEESTRRLRGHTLATQEASEVTSEYIPKFDQLLGLSSKLADETERYNEKQGDLITKQAEVKAQIDELIALGWSPLSDKVRDLQQDYDDLGVKYQENADKHNEAMARIQYDLLITKLSVDGLTDAEFLVAQQAGLMFGVFDQESVDAAKNMDLVAQAVTDGKIKVEDMGRALELLPKLKNIDVVINAIANIPGALSGFNPQAQAGGYGYQGYNNGFAAGGIATGPDSGYMELLHGTEAVIPLQNGSIPVQLNGGMGGSTVNVYLTIAPQGVTVLDETMTADFLKPYVVQAVNEAQAEGMLQ